MLGLDPRPVEEALSQALSRALEAEEATAALVVLRALRTERLSVRAPVGVEPGTLARVSAAASAARAGDREDPIAEALEAAGFAGRAAAPLLLAGTAVGTVHVLRRDGPLAAGTAERVAREVCPLAHSLRSLEAARDAEARNEVVAQVARGTLQHLDLQTLFPELIRLVTRLGPCDAASMAVSRPDLGSFELVATYGTTIPELIGTGVLIPAGETPILEAWTDGEPIVVGDQRHSPFPRARQLAEAGILSALYLPVGSPAPLGVLCVGKAAAHGFFADDVALFRSLVPFLEIALRNADLVGRIRTAYRELEATQERLVQTERLRALGELAAGVAHEVGNLLAVVASHAQLISLKVTDDESRRLLETCRRSVTDGSRSVERLLDLARGGGEGDAASAARLRLDVVAREALALARPRWQELGARGHSAFQVDETGLEPMPETPGEPRDARECVLNLLLNALDAMPSGGPIAVSTRREGDRALLVVEDGGPGVPDALREKIFEPFFSGKGPGHAGLGLALVARFARRHGGSIRVTRSALGGARFELRLPLRPPTGGSQRLPRVDSARATAPKGVVVLLVEDEPAQRRALAELLKIRGYVVETAGDVAQAIASLAARSDIKVVVTDLGLPGESGWDLVDHLKTSRPSLPVVVLSGIGSLTDHASACERGASAVLTKPTSDLELAETIASLTAS